MAVGSTFFWHSSVTVPWYLNGGSRAMMPCKFRAWHHAAMHGPSFSQKNNGSGSEPWVLPAGNLNASTTREYRHFTISQNACCLSSYGQKHGPSPFWRNDHIVTYISGWWFGTFGLCFHSVGKFIIPTVTQSIIFQRGWLNHQPWPGLKADPWRLGKLGEIKSWWLSLEKKSLEYYKYL